MKRSGIETITFLKKPNIFSGLDNKKFICPIIEVFAGTDGLCEAVDVATNRDVKNELALNTANRITIKTDNPAYIFCFSFSNGIINAKNESIT